MNTATTDLKEEPRFLRQGFGMRRGPWNKLLLLSSALFGGVGALAQYNPPATPAPYNPIALAEVTGTPRTAVQAGQNNYQILSQSPYLGGVPAGGLSATPVALSLDDAVALGLKQNLGRVLATDAITDARGQRWQALSELLPHVITDTGFGVHQINVRAAFGLTIPGEPPIIGPFGHFDSRAISRSPPSIGHRSRERDLRRRRSSRRSSDLSDVDAAPLLCAGSNIYNALRYAGALPGDLVAVQGIGGIGHLGIQFANKFGYKVAAVGRGSQIESLAMKLGADVYIDNKVKNAAEELQKLGGARAIIATAPNSKAMTELIGGLGPNGKLLLIGVASDPIEVAPVQLIRGGKTIEGWAGVTPADSDDALRFAGLRGIRAMIETYPLEKAAEAYARMMSGNAEFRVVLTM
jgi:hypothetical protein